MLESRSCSEVGVPSDDGESDVLLDRWSAPYCVWALVHGLGRATLETSRACLESYMFL